jgi:glycosyltransferase involved in cell wall biosynthesis
MAGNKQFSALVSLYKNDNLSYFKEALESVFNQTLPPAEVIIAVDGPVPAETEDFIRRAAEDNPKIKNVFLAVNIGRGAALGKVLPMCKYPLVALVDADDINLPARFEKLFNCFEYDSALSVVGGQIEEADPVTLKPFAERKVPLSDADIKKYIKTRSPFNQMTVMLKKEDVLKAGGYRTYHLFEDYDLWVRMAAAGLKMQNLPDTLVKARVDANLYARRGGYKYFKSNKALQDQLLALGMISIPLYIFNIILRFTVQVLMPNYLRGLFYKKALRANNI